MIRNTVLRMVVKAIANLLTPVAPRYRHWGVKNTLLRFSGMDIGSHGVAIGSGFQCIDGHEEGVKIDSYVAIGHNVKFWNFGKIEVGRFAMLAAGVTVTNGWHDKRTFAPSSGATIIGPGCWIGANAIIIGSRKIGTNSIIAAGAVVNMDVPENSIVAGVPAKVIGVRDVARYIWHHGDIYFDSVTFQVRGNAENKDNAPRERDGMK